VFASQASLGPAIALTVATGYGVAIVALLAALSVFRNRAVVAH
jgi:hypothetical protein